jgi:hypothetical protein
VPFAEKNIVIYMSFFTVIPGITCDEGKLAKRWDKIAGHLLFLKITKKKEKIYLPENKQKIINN